MLRNNELMRAQAEYEQELHRLLLNISAKLAAEADPLERVYECVSELDCAAAAARWAYSENGVFVPDTGSSQYFYLQAARHPLLGAAAVPIDLKLAADERILIITGPNTGGKTVSLKTAALFVLLNQTGWPVLAGEDTRLPVFRYVGCAIGDEQSLERSLSTFSAYMRTVGGYWRRRMRKASFCLTNSAAVPTLKRAARSPWRFWMSCLPAARASL